MYNAPVVRDLRNQIEGATSLDPFNMGPMRERINREFPPRQRSPPRHHDERPRRPQEVWNPFLPGQRPVNNYRNQINPWLQPTDNRANRDTAHHSRTFIESQHTSRDEGTMTDQEPEATNQEKEAESNDRGREQNKPN